MSEVFDIIKSNNYGYLVENYGENKDIFSLKDILRKEMFDLGNIDIPLYLEKQSLLSLKEYKLSTERFGKIVNEEYVEWLTVNNLKDNLDSLKIFEEDCQFKSIQYNFIDILEDVKEFVSEELNEKDDNIKCIWLSTKDIANKKLSNSKKIELPSEYMCISDIGEEGILIAFK